MGRFLHSVVRPLAALTASADITPLDLPVNPLSLVLLRFRVTNVSPAAIGTYSAWDDLIGQITNVNIKHLGEIIVGGSLRDLMGVNMVYQRVAPRPVHAIRTNGAIRDIVFPLCLGRAPYHPKSCFPPTTRGNLKLELTSGALGTGYSAVSLAVETVELIDATPEEYVKYTTNSGTSVVGQFDAALPIGNKLLGILLFDTGLRTNTTNVTSWGALKVLKDNVEQMYAQTDIRTLAGMLHLNARDMFDGMLGHIHQINDGAALSSSDDAEAVAGQGLDGYGYLDFDVTRDGEYALETAGAADLKIRGVGEEATAVRWLPLELRPIGK
jgi:hypothetical protein